MPISWFSGWALVASGQDYTNSIPLGTGWSPGDLRIFFLTTSTSRNFQTLPSGWTTLYNNTLGSRTLAVIARELQSGDNDPSITISSPWGPNVAHSGVTLRDADNEAILGTTPSASDGPSSRNVVAPSVNTGQGILITNHWVTRLSGANSGSWGLPSGMSTVSSSLGDGPQGYNILMATQTTTGGASGTKTAVAASAGTWSALSIFIPEKVAAGLPPGQFLPFFGR